MSLNKAANWIYRRAELILQDVDVINGYAHFSMWLYKLKRPDKPSVFYLISANGPEDSKIIRIKRICNY